MLTERWSFKLTPMRVLLLAIGVLGLPLIVYRLYVGLGLSTNLNDQWPWGLWIVVDLSAIAIAGAGFSLAVLGYILNIKKFKPFTRHGLMISLMSYIFVLAVLILEIGRWDNFWRPFVSWGYHSPMFEVYMCIVGYVLMQAIEFAEIVTEKIGRGWQKIIAKLMPVVVIIAALLPFGHQASLGALYLIVPSKLDPIWSSELLPWLFLISAFFVGPAVVALESIRVNSSYNLGRDDSSIKSLIKVSGWVMLGYLALKVYDLMSRGVFNNIFSGTYEANMFLVEIILGVLIPIVICFSPLINSRFGQVLFSLLAIVGVILSRFNVVYTGMYQALGPGYVPSWIEWGITISLVALILLVYLFITENFNVFTKWEKPGTEAKVSGTHVSSPTIAK